MSNSHQSRIIGKKNKKNTHHLYIDRNHCLRERINKKSIFYLPKLFQNQDLYYFLSRLSMRIVKYGACTNPITL